MWHRFAGDPFAIALASFGLLWATGCHTETLEDARRPNSSDAASPTDDLKTVNDWVAAGQLDRADQWVTQMLDDGEQTADALRTAAEIKHRRGDFGAAADLLVRAVRRDENQSPRLIDAAVDTLKQTGQPLRELRLLGEAVDRHPDRHDWRFRRVELAFGLERRDEAETQALELVRQRRFNLGLLERLAWDGERELDVQPLIEAAKQHPDQTELWVGVLRRRIERSEFASADDIADDLQRHVPKDPAFAYWQAQRIIRDPTMDNTDRRDAAVRWFDSNLPAPEHRTGRVWLAAGQMARLLEHDDLADQCFDAAVTLNPRLSEAYLTSANPNNQTVEALKKLSDLLGRWRTKQRSDLAVGVAIVEQLASLDRVHEAEAWATALAVERPELMTTDVANARRLIRTRTRLLESLSRSDADRRDAPEDTSANASAVASANESLNDWLASLSDPERFPVQRGDAAALASRSTQFAPPRFIDVAPSMRLRFRGRTGDGLNRRGIMLHQTLGCGGGTLDYDRDGYDDLALADAGGRPLDSSSRTNRLFRQTDRGFDDVTDRCGYDDRGFGQGVAIGDVNHDGWDDVFDANYGRNRLYLNRGDGTFAVHNASDDLASWSTSAAIADVDHDGLADVVYVNYCDDVHIADQVCSDDKRIVTRDEWRQGQPPSHHACSPIQYPAARNRWMRGTPDPSSIARTRSTQFLGDVDPGRSLGLLLFRDPDSDAASSATLRWLVTNDMSGNEVGTFDTDGDAVSQPASVMGLANGLDGRPEGSMGIAVADVNEDDRLDFLVTNFENEPNTLYVSDGPVYQTPPQSLAEQSVPSVGFGAVAEDFDESGRLLWIVANGHVDDFSDLRPQSSLMQPMQFFTFGPGGRVQSVGPAESFRYAHRPHCGRALWTIDLASDGRLDLVATHMDEPVALLRNDFPTADHRRFTNVQCVGVRNDRNAIGTAITMRMRDGTSITRSLWTGGYLSTSADRVHFSWADANPPVELIVRWSDGSHDRHPSPDQWPPMVLCVQDQPLWENVSSPVLR